MVKYDNLSYQAKQKLEAEYARRNPPPTQPEEYRDPSPSPPLLLPAGKGKIFVAPDTDGSYRAHEKECVAEFTVAIGRENTIVSMTADELRRLRNEIDRQIFALDEINAARRAHHAALKQHEAALATWKEQGRLVMKKALAGGTITEAMIMDDIEKVKF